MTLRVSPYESAKDDGSLPAYWPWHDPLLPPPALTVDNPARAWPFGREPRNEDIGYLDG